LHLWPALLGVIAVSAAAWMIWRMQDLTLKARTAPTEPVATIVKHEPGPAAAAPAQDSPKPAAKPPSAPLFDEKSVMMPPEARREFDLACEVLRRAFTGSISDTTLESCVRHPELTMPRVRSHPASRRVVPVMPLEIGPKFGVTNELLLTTLRLADGSYRPVAMEKTDGGYLLDWESLTGWCEASFTDLLNKPTGRARLMRVQCRQASAKAPYGLEKGTALVLSHPAEGGSLSAFAPETLLSANAEGKALATARDALFTLRVIADTEHAAQGWVRVVQVVSQGWVTDK
jgi:hypothetical protein